MNSYELSSDAKQDLREIARYTGKKWGRGTLEKYRSGLNGIFESIGKGAVQNRQFSKELPDLLVTKYRFHFVFYLTENLPKPVITRVIHERRDIVNRLSDRLT